MSSDETNPKSGEKPKFTEKEEQILKVAWRCLKGGPPEVDIEKLKEYGGFNTVKTASNTWGVIKKKLMTDSDGNPLPVTPKKAATAADSPAPKPKAAAATPRKRGKKVAADDSEDEGITFSHKKAKQNPAKANVKKEFNDDE